MAKKFSELEKKMSPESRSRSDAEYRKLAEELPLHAIRAARELTQQQLASTLEIAQSEVSKIEHRTDLYLSTLRRFIEAMGGRLELRAVFPDKTMQIKSLEGPAGE